MTDIKNLKRAATRIKKAVKNQEKIILYGDSDLDGVTSVLILEESIKSLSGNVAVIYFPDWETEDYGLNDLAIKTLEPESPALLILLDCGIGNFEELKQAKKMGFDVIVIDHHEILGKVPNEALVVDPKQPGDEHEFKKLTTVSIVYELCCILLSGKSHALNQSFIELAALGTIADMMPEEGTNGFVIAAGLPSIESTMRPGLKAAIDVSIQGDVTPRGIFQKLVAVLNISNVNAHLTQTYELLSSDDYEKAKVLASELLLASEKRSQDIYDIVGGIASTLEGSHPVMIFEGSTDWSQVLTGAIASRLCNKFKKPVFVFKTKEFKSKGSVRTPKGVDAVTALKACDKYLDMYGGHPPAAGFTLKNENLEKFKKCLTEYFKKIS